MSLAEKVLRRFLAGRRAKTTPLPPSFPKTEIGLMTREEFLTFRNPGNKHHTSDSYDFDLFHLNHEHPQSIGGIGSSSSERVEVELLSGGYRVLHEGKVVGVIHDGIAYYDNPHWRRRIPTRVLEHGGRGEAVEIPIRSFKQVKYLSEVAPLISPIAKKNKEHFPVLLQHILIAGEPMTVRAEKEPKEDKGVTLAILNAEGLIVAQASNEWGATLLTVAQEYRGRGLGKIIGKFWYELNPSFESGGFTDAGQENALALWRDRVHEFSARGWYSALIREGRLTPARVKEILAGADERPPRVERVPQAEPEKVEATGDILVYCDEDISFVVYDRAFLEEQDERFIHGYGFFRDAPLVGVFLYRIDYDRPFADITTRVALQMARDAGNDIYDGEGYHDMLEIDQIPGVIREGDYIKVTRDLLPLKAMVLKEKRTRKAVDPLDEKHNLLIEMAESKWS
jgi:GNAT superfamily N-acetyltransferase